MLFTNSGASREPGRHNDADCRRDAVLYELLAAVKVEARHWKLGWKANCLIPCREAPRSDYG